MTELRLCPFCNKEQKGTTLVICSHCGCGYQIEITSWISVEERLPHSYNKYLVYLADGLIAISASDLFGDDVTHWMPLPKSPEDEK